MMLLGGRIEVEMGKDFKEDDPILRYMNYSQFKDFFSNGLKLTKAAKYAQDDPFEGEFIEYIYSVANDHKIYSESKGTRTYQTDSLKIKRDKAREKSYVSCWTLSNNENVALWKIYGKENNSLAIKTTVIKLKQAIETYLTTSNEKDALLMRLLRKKIVKVEYINHRTENQEDSKKLFDIPAAWILHYKNIAYKHEEEVRVIFDCVELGRGDPSTQLGDSCTIKISPSDFAAEIIVSPFADEWFYDFIRHAMDKHKMTESVKWSNLSLKFNPGAYANSQTSEYQTP